MHGIGDTIRVLRKSRGWSAQRLSDELGGVVTRAVISDLETGRKRSLSLEAGVALAQVFGLTAEELLAGDAVVALKRAELEARLNEAASMIDQLKTELLKLA